MHYNNGVIMKKFSIVFISLGVLSPSFHFSLFLSSFAAQVRPAAKISRPAIRVNKPAIKTKPQTISKGIPKTPSISKPNISIRKKPVQGGFPSGPTIQPIQKPKPPIQKPITNPIKPIASPVRPPIHKPVRPIPPHHRPHYQPFIPIVGGAVVTSSVILSYDNCTDIIVDGIIYKDCGNKYYEEFIDNNGEQKYREVKQSINEDIDSSSKEEVYMEDIIVTPENTEATSMEIEQKK